MMVTNSSIKLFCFPFAGGNSYSYNNFKPYLSNNIELIQMDVPGHGRRLREPLLNSIDEMANDILEHIKKHAHAPYAIFGHSMGSIIAYSVAKKAVKEKIPLPVHLFLSGRSSAVYNYNNEAPKHLLPKKEFLDELYKLGGIPKEIIDDEELMNFFEPILRADIEAVEKYKDSENTPFNIPLTVLVGKNDASTNIRELKWQENSLFPISVHEFDGGHFFINDHSEDITKLIQNTLLI